MAKNRHSGRHPVDVPGGGTLRVDSARSPRDAHENPTGTGVWVLRGFGLHIRSGEFGCLEFVPASACGRLRGFGLVVRANNHLGVFVPADRAAIEERSWDSGAEDRRAAEFFVAGD